MNFGDYISQKRKEKNFTIRELANKLNISFTYLSDVEKGRAKAFKQETLKKIIEVLQLNKDDNQTLLNLQKQFENNEIDLSVMSDEEIDALNSLYKKQVSELKKILDNKQTELNIIQYRIKGYSSNK